WAERVSAIVHGAAEDDAIGPRKIDVLKNALLKGLFGGEVNGFDSRARDAYHFPGLNFADVLGVQKIERARFRSYEPGVTELAEIQRTKAAWVAYGVEFVGREYEQG